MGVVVSAITIPIVTEQQWLAERTRDVTSTEVAALYGLSPYLTHFELWHQKRDGFIEERRAGQRIHWGNRLQDAIAAGVAEDRGWSVRRLNVYMRDEQDRLGSSFDFEVLAGGELVPGGDGNPLLEIKNVDNMVFRDEWIDGDAGIEAPQHIELQVQVQMEVANRPWCALVALVGGNDAKVTIRMRDRQIGQDIRRHVRDFWRSIDAGAPPTPDYRQDAEFLCRLHGRADANLTVDADAETADLIARYVAIGEIAKEREAIKAQVFERVGKASRVRTQFGSLACGEVKANPGTEITPDMVGQRTGARAGFRMFRFTETKKNP